jgi:hypothetical protein
MDPMSSNQSIITIQTQLAKTSARASGECDGGFASDVHLDAHAFVPVVDRPRVACAPSTGAGDRAAP